MKKSKVVASSVGQVKVVTDRYDNIQFQIPTCFAQAYYLDTKGNPKRQHYISFGAKSNPHNLSLAESQRIHLQAAMSGGAFVPEDETKYKHPDKQIRCKLGAKNDNFKSYVFGASDLFNMYLNYRKSQISESSYQNYDKTFRRAIASACQDLQDPLSIRNSVVSSLNPKTGEPIGISTKIGTLELLGTVCKWAIREGYLPETYKNRFPDYSKEETRANRGLIQKPIPQSVMKYVNPVQGIRAWTLEERDIIIKAFHNRRTRYPYNQLDTYAYLVEFLFLVGCRHGEAFGLNWGDVLSMDNQGRSGNFISITRAWDSNTRKMNSTTKTGKSRIVPLSPRCMEILNILRPPGAEMNSTIFRPALSPRFSTSSLDEMWAGHSSRNKMGIVTGLVQEGVLKRYMEPYSTRRTFTSICVNVLGKSVPTVAAWIGDNPETVLQYYAAADTNDTPW